jgi:hypothetical protein
MRAVRGREITLRLHVDNELGDLVTADSPPTVAVTDMFGDPVTTSAVTSASIGIYTAVVAPLDDVDILSVEWTVVVGGRTRKVNDTVIVQDRRLAPLWFLRQDPELAAITSAAVMQSLVDAVEDWFQSALGFAPVETPLSTTFDAPGGKSLRVPGATYPRRALYIDEDGTELTTDELNSLVVVNGAFEAESIPTSHIDGLLYFDNYYWMPGRKTVIVTHGGPPEWNNDVPADLMRAARIFARYTARGSNYPERARMVQTEGAMIQFSTPSPDRPTGLPDVDAVITRYGIPAVV